MTRAQDARTMTKTTGRGRASYCRAMQLARSKRYRDALAPLELSASLGYAPAHQALGTWWLHGRAVGRNPQRAVASFEIAAAAGHVDAMVELAICHELGRGTRADAAVARRWYARAARHRSREAKAELARMFYYGLGGARDVVVAVRLYRHAAKRGDVESAYCAGTAYELGEGVRRNRRWARYYYGLAAAGGCRDAARALRSLARSKG